MTSSPSLINWETTRTEADIQEESYRNISLELHDNICQSILLAILSLEKANAQEFQPDIQESILILQHSLQELSSLSRSLNGDIIKSVGLRAAIQDQVDKLNRTASIKVYFTICGKDCHLTGSLELALFRIIQESINNIIKHARADTVHILLMYGEQQVRVRVRDNGKGFDPEQVGAFCSGLQNMRKRIQSVRGTIQIDSKPGKGTSIELTAPLAKP